MDETQRMLELLNASFPDITSMAPPEARALVDARVRPVDNLDDGPHAVDTAAPAGDHRVPLRVYTPHKPRRDAPAVVFAHGGGFLHGSIASHDGFCRRWAKGTGSTVISVEYRLAPEHRPPTALEDVIAAVRWAQQTGLAEHGLVIAGDSSGGNLAAGATLALRDEGDSPLIGQVLLYPFLDPAMTSDSYRTRATGYFVTAKLLGYYWRTYLGEDPAAWASDAVISPLAASDLSGLPPAIVVTAGLDPLSDEGIAYASRLRHAGTTVLERRYPDQFHGFLTIPGYGPATSASEMLWADIRTLFSPDKDNA